MVVPELATFNAEINGTPQRLQGNALSLLAAELRKLGAKIEEQPDGFTVEGPTPLQGAPVESHGDHRLGMALVVAGLVASGETVVQGADCIADSFPGFARVLAQLGAELA